MNDFSIGTDLEVTHMLMDAKSCVDTLGTQVTYLPRKEANITRDGYNSIVEGLAPTTYTFNAHPFTTSPAVEKLEKLGIFVDADILFYLAHLDLKNNALTYKSIDMTRSGFKIFGEKYEIVHKGKGCEYKNDFAYIVIAVKKQ